MMNSFDFEKEYILENEAALLRPLQLNDIDYLQPYSLNEPELWTYSLVSAAGKDQLKLYINQAIQQRLLGKEYPFIVFDKRLNEYAGNTRFYDIQLSNKSLQIGYTWYGSKFHGNGLNKHCKYLLLSFAFETMGMDRVEFRADNDNKRSIQAMRSIGCTVEGVLRDHMLRPDQSRRDSIVLSILKNEWDQGIKEALRSKLL